MAQQSTSEPPEGILAKAGRVVFSLRLLIALAAVIAGGFVIHPRHFTPAIDSVVLGISIVLIVAGLALRAWAGGCAGRHTRSTSIEAPRLSTGGPYAYVRNPIYLGSILAGYGLAALTGDPWMLLLAAIAFSVLYVTIVPAEEHFLRSAFGEKYAEYARAVPCLIPRLHPWTGRTPTAFRWRSVARESSTALIFLAVFTILHIACRMRGV